ncbi:MAG TPA: LysR family transcriptional regulator [Candidatus Merdiplasma excrementigallinarum]|uniref:LysR family transcriptional regulator n=1 Tax=Candidatus Merdiplasma excrementigallinarum TaxID=2840864 RepID=A0A9D1P021_9FIRM|nr:LysR family transcriptional regulator [Candidatus Merdiplasma excrementigallinarum]
MANYDYYRIFYYVAQYRSFTKAAEILNNNQPNITRCMNNLESELNCRLFIRTNRGVSLTPEGERLLRRVSVAFRQLMMGEEELKRDQSLESGVVHIGCSETSMRLLLLEKLSRFHESYPHIRLHISSQSTPRAIAALENGHVDFSVVTTPVHIKKPLHETSLYPFRDILIGGLKYSYLAGKPHPIGDLCSLPFVSLCQGTGTRELYDQYFLRYNLPFHPDIETAIGDQILPMILHNLGIGFFPQELAAPAIARGEIVQIPLEEDTPQRQVCLIRDVSRSQSIAARKLIETLLPKA